MQQDTRQQRADHISGSDLPKGDGTVGDEQVHAINDDGTGKKTVRDHSTEHHERTIPRDGVGAVQDSSDTTSDIAHISD